MVYLLGIWLFLLKVSVNATAEAQRQTMSINHPERCYHVTLTPPCKCVRTLSEFGNLAKASKSKLISTLWKDYDKAPK